MSPEGATILSWWFDQLGAEGWWTHSAATDETVRERFHDLWTEWRSRTPESFLGSPREALAAVILFDQFPRNMFRGHAEAFATDSLALAIAKGAVDRGYDEAMSADERSFLYMPFQHSEDLDDQERSLLLFSALGLPESVDYARRHHDIIARFGRFPHRNEVLGRQTRPEELEAVTEGKGW